MRGFTLMELVMVLVLIGIVALVAIPRSPGTSASLSTQAEQLAADIRYVQSLAMAQGVRYRLCLAAGGYTIATTNCATPTTHPATGTTAPVSFTGVTLTWSAGLTNNYIAFDSAGVPYTTDPGTALAADATITLTSNQSGTSVVTVTPQTGRVTP